MSQPVEATYGDKPSVYEAQRQRAKDAFERMQEAWVQWKKAVRYFKSVRPTSSDFKDAANTLTYAYQQYIKAVEEFYSHAAPEAQ